MAQKKKLSLNAVMWKLQIKFRKKRNNEVVFEAHTHTHTQMKNIYRDNKMMPKNQPLTVFDIKVINYVFFLFYQTWLNWQCDFQK